MDQGMNRSCGKRPGKNQFCIENSYALVRFTNSAWDRHQFWVKKQNAMKKQTFFVTFGTSGAAFGWPVAKPISLESGVFSSISHESGINFRLKRTIFNELSLVFALLELPGAAFWSSGGIARLGMNGLCGILAISHLGGTVDDDDGVTHLDIPLPPPHHAQEKNTSWGWDPHLDKLPQISPR